MNILLIGNGFDLAHGLPTKYQDFLNFVKVVKQIINIKNQANLESLDWGNLNNRVKSIIEKQMGNVRNNIFSQREMWNYLLTDNVWIEYFLNNTSYIKENWIDFESEISKVIQDIYNDMKRMKVDTGDIVRKISDSFFSDFFVDDIAAREEEKELEILQSVAGKMSIDKQSKFVKKIMDENPIEILKEEITYKQLIQRLDIELKKLIRALEIYLVEYVNEIEITQLALFQKLSVDHVLSFNYTDIFEKNYKNEKFIKFDYIHGKAIHESDKKDTVNYGNLININNMVLGIDEYLPKKRRNKDLEFIIFKKYYQRIYKHTGCKYKDWIDEIRNKEFDNKEQIHRLEKQLDINQGLGDKGYTTKIKLKELKNTPKHNLYIFGHSLDITDKDILKELILCDNIVTTIYYPDDEELGRKIANLVKIIGQKELIRKTGGDIATIKFVPQ